MTMAQLTFLNTAWFDHGALASLREALQRQGITRPLVCTDKGIVAAGILDVVRGQIGNEVQPTIYDGTPENPTEEAVLEAAKLYKENGCDGIVSVGGGSAMDLGKGVALMVSHEGDLVDYAAHTGGTAKIGACAPQIAIPTTAGTGSEVSSGAVISMIDGRKLVFSSPQMRAREAICDPDLTLGLPARLTAATGMDAMTHCIEAVLSARINPPAEAVGLDGLARGIGEGWLFRAVDDGQDKDARWNMMLASTEGAMAFSKGLGAVHALSHAAGRIRELKLHHGTLNAVILPSVLRYNADHVGDKFARLRQAMKLPAGADLPDAIQEINRRIGLPANLREMGVTPDRIPGMVEQAMQDVCTLTNPRVPTADEYARLYEEAMG